MKRAQDFMNKWAMGHEEWEEFFEQAFRVLKYGSYAILFGIDRQLPFIQYYAVKAGFEVQQSLYHYFISNFPKSSSASKNIDKRGGVNYVWFGEWFRKWRRERNISSNDVAKLFLSKTGNITGCVRNWELGLTSPSPKQFSKLVKYFNLPFIIIL